jgi:parallel beta-helix repeat protein
MKAKRSLGLVAVGTGLVVIGGVVAGPLTPPAGPVGSTYKTLTEVEPRIAVQSLTGFAQAQYLINQPGSYYLTGPITGVSGKKGIWVNAPNVTIDLCGFAMDGAGVGDDAIYADSNYSGLTVRNGVISNWVKEGVDYWSNFGTRLEGLQVRASVAGWGLVAGPGSTVVNCIVQSSGAGIVANSNCSILDCMVEGNPGGGIYVGDGCTLARCTSVGGTTFPAPGFSTGAGCTLDSCTARGNNGYGIDAGDDCVLTGCTVTANSQGIRVNSGGAVRGCTSTRNTAGHGIHSTIGGTTIQGCTASFNGADGIRVAANCFVLNNTCNSNGAQVGTGGSGIFTAGNSNRIDSNVTNFNFFGVALNGAGNLMVRNLATGNTNGPYQLIAGNRWAQVINNPAAGFVSTDPWSNIQY